MTEIKSTEHYRQAIRRSLAESDPALIQDALYDVDEFLRSERSPAGGDLSDQELAERAVQGFGTPEEVAASYRETDRRVANALATPALAMRLGSDFFGVLLDPHAYGALFLMLFGLLTGIFYFTWAITGVAMSLGFAILIIGIPFFIGFAGSLRMLGLLEGRLLEGLIGVRMPRRPAPAPTERAWLRRAGYWLSDRRTWLTLVYLVLSLPLGIITFTVAVVLLSFALAFFAAPLAQPFFDFPLITIGSSEWYVSWRLFPVFWLIAVFFDLLLLHTARLFGRMKASLARAMLVA